ncbi:MAG: ATP-dependent DNA helicase RecG [Bacillota bacterium]
MLETPLTNLRGIGPKRAELLEGMGIRSVADLLYTMPRAYLDYSAIQPVAMLRHGDFVAVRATVLLAPHIARIPGGRTIVETSAQDGTAKLRLVWFNQPYRMKAVVQGQSVVACGRVDRRRGITLVNPNLYEEPPGILAVYPLVKELTQKQMRDAVAAALKTADGTIKEALPSQLRACYGLCEINDAIRNAHIPIDPDALERARRRISFENMLYYQLILASLRRERERDRGYAFNMDGLKGKFLSLLPFSPTGAQGRVLDEIEADMRRPNPMNRLVQGDVGSGKTIPALYAIFGAVQNGCQGVLMAPTEILAEQHYALMRSMFGDAALLMRGKMKKRERAEALEAIATGRAKAIVGTHALLEEDVSFHKLGLVVADEQHRFGVKQRAKIFSKGERPDMLIMSATPIPRTLAMLLFSELDFSVLDELPPGRKPVKTRLVPESKRLDMYRYIEKLAREGHQAYVVCPAIDTAEMPELKSAQQVYGELTELLPGARVVLLHGRMKNEEKQRVIEEFRRGDSDILVSTTVIEVGVDVPKATVMVVENAERFGLAQLHQLRGRVGRGGQEAFCFLLSESDAKTASERLGILVETADGFLIAQKDLELRGPGEFLGMRQHGASDFEPLLVASEMGVLFDAQSAAAALFEEPEFSELLEPLMREAKSRYAHSLKNIAKN